MVPNRLDTWFEMKGPMNPDRTNRQSRSGRIGVRVGLMALLPLVALVTGFPVWAGDGSVDKLHRLRADRREAMRMASAAANEDSAAALFGLLVIPVDFSDYRLPDDWDANSTLAPRLFPLHGETLANYFRIASRGRLELRILLSPLVHLPGQRIDYSDIGRIGYFLTRRLATESITAVRDMGLDFRELDMEGPDGRPGSQDDDGVVDGVLILHAAPGQENDPENGWIQALQFFLEEPVSDRGVFASSYAVASQQSGLGIWAHEVGHLFGLEDRYDPHQISDSGDLLSLGGLGKFSLMAAGAWGRGDGSGAALLDAYSAEQLGWIDISPFRGSSGPDTLRHSLITGEAWRIWTQGRTEQEYFILETRGGDVAAPFDAEVPSGQLMIYHIDETLADGVEAPPTPVFPEPHLRVALVEADNDGKLRRGEDHGRPEDLFPGPLQVTEWTPMGVPSSWGYWGATEISISEITPLPRAVALQYSDAASFGFTVDLTATIGTPKFLRISIQEIGLPVTDLSARLSINSAPAWGSFAGGAMAVTVEMVHEGDGRWIAVADPEWFPDVIFESTAETLFRIRLFTGGEEVQQSERTVLWKQELDPLAIDSNWPGDWTISSPTGQFQTTWHRWAGGPTPTADDSPVLICTGEEYTSPADWSQIRYSDNAEVILESGWLAQETSAIRVVHAISVELSRPGAGWDGGLVEIGLPDGSWQAATPLAGYGAEILSISHNPLHGRPAFAGEDSLTASGPYAWRQHVVPLPQTFGPLRLRLRFASDEKISRRGWVIARLESLPGLPPDGSFPVAVLAGVSVTDLRIAWDWIWEPTASFAIEVSENQGASWRRVWQGTPTGAVGEYPWAVSLDEITGGVAVRQDVRNLIRVLAQVDYGWVASQPHVLYRDGGAGPSLLMSAPYPNPATGPVRFLLQIPGGQEADLSLYDLRGRRLRQWRLVGGQQLFEWDGMDSFGRRAAAGTYFLHLRTGNAVSSRKVVYLP